MGSSLPREAIEISVDRTHQSGHDLQGYLVDSIDLLASLHLEYFAKLFDSSVILNLNEILLHPQWNYGSLA